MQSKETHHPPLDHAGARIVSELADRLLPPLREALFAMERREEGGMDGTLEEVLERVARIEKTSDALARKLERSDELSRPLTDLLPELASFIKSFEEKRATPPAPPQPQPLEEKSDGRMDLEGDRLIELMENRIPTWEGLLRAHNQAQSRELNALSAELAEMQNETASTLLRAFRETLRQELADRDALWSKRQESLLEAAQQRTNAMLRLVWASIGIGMASLLLLVAVLLRLIGF